MNDQYSRLTDYKYRWLFPVMLGLMVCVLLFSTPLYASAPSAEEKWVATWAQSMTSGYSLDKPAARSAGVGSHPTPHAPRAHNITLRQTVVASVGGSKVRVQLSNYFGLTPLTISTAHIALAAKGSSNFSTIAVQTDHALTFDGKASITIAPGHVATSDPVALRVPKLSQLVVSMYFARATSFADLHPLEPSATTAVVRGNAVSAPAFAKGKLLRVLGRKSRRHVYILSGIDVLAPASTRVVVAFGDSITDGAYATSLDSPWPEQLAVVANSQPGAAPVAVVNAGISANELTTDQIGYPKAGMSGLKRFERDVIEQAGVTDVIVLLGTNDLNRGIGPAGYPTGASANDLIASFHMLADVAHVHHLRIYAGTIPPFAGFKHVGWYTPGKEAIRERVNHWIRTAGIFDGVIRFSSALAGEYVPSALAAEQHPLPPGLATICAGDSGLHPNDRGYTVMGTLAYNRLFNKHPVPQKTCHV